ncbi:hypothetical protein GLYMA_U043101v4 [Glycine max]|nr:hypothetical protein GLYMA_U043101v4 [Glycine max]
MTHSLNDVEAIHATPESICNPTNYDIGCDDVVNNPKKMRMKPHLRHKIQSQNEEDPLKRHLNRLKIGMFYAKNERSPIGSIRLIFIRRHAFGVGL